MRRHRFAFSLASAVLIASCATEPAKPAAMAIASGDNQSGLPGSVLAESLVVLVSGSDGAGFPGATVTWEVATGTAIVSPLTSVSAGTGHAASAVTLAATGPGTVTATVDGLAPVTFHLTAASPCAAATPLTFTATVNGALSALDCLYADGSYVDYYELVTPTQQAVRIRMTAATFDTFLYLNTSNDVPVAGNDDDANSTNSDIKVVVAPGSYILGANSFEPATTGAYTLTTEPMAEDFAGCVLWFVTPAVLTSQQLAATDCVSGGFYADLVVIFLQGGRAYTITQTSAGFDTYLELLNSAGIVVAADDNGAGGTNSRIVFTPTASNIYYIAASSLGTGITGAYTLAVAAPVPAGARSASAIRTTRQRATTWPLVHSDWRGARGRLK